MKNPNYKNLLIEWLRDSGVSEVISETRNNYYLQQPQNKINQKNAETNKTQKILNLKQSNSINSSQLPKNGIKYDNLESIKSLEELLTAIKKFKGCDLRKTAKNLVFADGNAKSKVMLIGEAPGADEDRLGKPFVGQSGKLLDKMLSFISLNRSKIYITNIVPWRPPGNRQPKPDEISMYLPFVKKHIEIIAPKIIVLLGSVATKSILNVSEGITKLRGRWHDYKMKDRDRPINIIPTFHPAYLLRSPGQKEKVWEDLLKIEKKYKSIVETE
ncbi:MAG: uracil-DNA glycosylase [Pseudomonadota bacterium]|nr:uracil-DNA glycosylase [Pseudomonadota bacterium]